MGKAPCVTGREELVLTGRLTMVKPRTPEVLAILRAEQKL